MKKKWLPLLILALVVGAVLYGWLQGRSSNAPPVLYGTVELRQAALSFNNGERVREVLVEEGQRVKTGQVLARVDSTRLTALAAQASAQAAAARETLKRLQTGARAEELAQSAAEVEALRQIVARLKMGARPEELAQAAAQAEALRQIVTRLKNGARPEELAQARARLEAAQAAEHLATQTLKRLQSLRVESAGAVSQQDLEAAEAAAAGQTAARVVAENALQLATAGPRAEEVAEAVARLQAAEHTLALMKAGPRAEEIAEAQARLAAAAERYALVKAGPRAEEIAEAEARLAAAQAQADWAARNLADADLLSPCDGVVRSRVLEPGELAAPQRPAVIVAETRVKWIRAYLAETELGAAPAGTVAEIAVDSFPDRRFNGWIGFISPVAEFTPRAVQTEELRTSLMYEVRVFVEDAQDELRLGMPATVRLTGQRRSPAAGSGADAGAPNAGAAQP